MRRLAATIAAVAALLVTTGCGGGPTTVVPSAPTPTTAAATDQTTMLPDRWPEQVQLPDGAEITSSSRDGDRMTVTFQSTDLGKPVADFLDKRITSAGFQKQNSATSGGTLTVAYSNGARQLTLAIVETAGDTSGTLTLAGK